MPKVQSVVPARAGSKGIANKNLSIVAGLPLIVRSLIHAMKTLPGVKPILSSDSLEYAEVASTYLDYQKTNFIYTNLDKGSIVDFGHFWFHFRSETTATDEAILPSVIEEISSSLPSQMEPEAWLVLQPTSPFRNRVDFEDWNRLSSIATRESSCVSFTSVSDSHPARMYCASGDSMKPLGVFPGLEQTPRQSLPPVYIRDGAFYLIGSNLIRDGRQFSHEPKALIRHYPWTINIDNHEDLMLATQLASTDASLNI